LIVHSLYVGFTVDITNYETVTRKKVVCFYMWLLAYPLGKGKAVPLQAWSGPEGSRKLRFPDFMTTAQDGGAGRLYPKEIHLVLISVRG